jgi:carboxymethylenebutenolidase
MTKLQIQTRDGSCPSYVYQPPGQGPWPGVLVFMDGLGIRPAMLEVGERIAAHGYFVLLPDLYYRSGPYAPMDPQTVFSDPEQRKVLFEKFMGPASTANILSDTRAFLDVLAGRAELQGSGIGTTGYCMGGRLSLAAAGTFPEQILAAAAYHPGRVATDAPDSPHLLAPRIRARVYIGQASEDPSFPEDMKALLETALTAANVDHRIETFPAQHGWVLRDTPVYDEAQSERHYQTLFALLDGTLRAAR